MQFKPELAQKILLNLKTQTRRTVKAGEHLVIRENGDKAVFSVDPLRLKWLTGQTYAIQPGRGKKAIGYFTLLDIQQERVQNISETDAIAEGVDKNCLGDWENCPGCLKQEYCIAEGEYHHYLRDLDDFPAYSATESFLSLFESINGAAALDKEVWVLTFEVVKNENPQS